MLQLLTIESLKLKNNRSFWVLVGLFVLSILGITYTLSELSSKIPLFQQVWQEVAYVCGFALVIPGMIIIMHTCAEYTYKTHRQNIIDGLSRNQYITTKLLFVVILALASTVLTFCSAFLVGLSSESAISFVNFKYVFYFFIQAMMYISVAFLCGLLFKRTALSIGIYFLYAIVLENVLERRINKLINLDFDLGTYLPLASSDHLVPSPSISTFFSPSLGSEISYVVVALCYIALCFALCYQRYQKQDL